MVNWRIRSSFVTKQIHLLRIHFKCASVVVSYLLTAQNYKGCTVQQRKNSLKKGSEKLPTKTFKDISARGPAVDPFPQTSEKSRIFYTLKLALHFNHFNKKNCSVTALPGRYVMFVSTLAKTLNVEIRGLFKVIWTDLHRLNFNLPYKN